MNIEDLTEDQKQELKDKGSITIDSEKYRLSLVLDIEILNPDKTLKEVL